MLFPDHKTEPRTRAAKGSRGRSQSPRVGPQDEILPQGFGTLIRDPNQNRPTPFPGAGRI